MKILYCAYHHNPKDPDGGSGTDYNIYQTLLNKGHVVRLIGPIESPPNILEKTFKRFYERVTKKRYSKFYISQAIQYSKMVRSAVQEFLPDVIFSIFPTPFVFYTGPVPCVFRIDAPVKGIEKDYADYGKFGEQVFTWLEKKAFQNVKYIVTHSEWCKDKLINEYHVDKRKVLYFPNPCSFPKSKALTEETILKRDLSLPIELLMVGKQYYGKGMDIAIKTSELLTKWGYPTHLTICGASGESTDSIRFMGLYKKKDIYEYEKYMQLFPKAHFFIHPTRFDASPIVTSEAAAFGLPVITNLVGGVGTSVLDGKTGVVLPRKSPPEKYAEAILNLYLHPDEYYQLAINSLKRFQTELNWEDAGNNLIRLFELAVE